MTRLPSLSSAQVTRALRRAGFADAPRRGKGSHRALCREDAAGRQRLVIIPRSRDLPKGTLYAILEQAGLTAEELRELLR
jgi:predicted RNA binding protein YcfA (HicA-like mRNA interferase family)